MGGDDKIRKYLANKTGKTVTVTGRFFGVYLPKFGLKKNMLVHDVTSAEGDIISDHMFVSIESYTTIEPDLKRGDIITIKGEVYKYKKHNGGKKMLTDFSIVGGSIKKIEK